MNGKPVVKARSQRRSAAETDLGFSWGAGNSLMLALGLGVLVAGYMSLAKGSITLAPILLVLGYVVLIPSSLLIRSRIRNSGE